MTVGYHINREQGLVTITGTDDVDMDEASDLGRRLLNDQTLDSTFPHLIDLRGVQVALTPEQTQIFRTFVLDEYCPAVDGSIAIVIDDSLDDRSCAALYHLSCSMDKAELFDHYDQALRWLMRNDFANP